MNDPKSSLKDLAKARKNLFIARNQLKALFDQLEETSEYKELKTQIDMLSGIEDACKRDLTAECIRLFEKTGEKSFFEKTLGIREGKDFTIVDDPEKVKAWVKENHPAFLIIDNRALLAQAKQKNSTVPDDIVEVTEKITVTFASDLSAWEDYDGI